MSRVDRNALEKTSNTGAIDFIAHARPSRESHLVGFLSLQRTLATSWSLGREGFRITVHGFSSPNLI